MDFRCAFCEHVGAPSGVLPSTDGGVLMVCSECGAENSISLTTDQADVDAPPPAKKPVTYRAEKKPDTALTETAFERLVPEEGDGFRCPKCIRIIDADSEHCSFCGLTIEIGIRHSREDGPWDTAPAGLEREFEQGRLLWKSTEQNPTDENFQKFVDFTNEHELSDLQTRRLRWFLVDNPGHTVALGHLRTIAESFQSRVIIAQAKSKARAQEFESEAQRVKRYLMVGMLAFWALIFIVALVVFASGF